MPIWNGSHQNVAFSGKRVKRGLYRTADGHLFHADTNEAANILRKSNHRLDVERVASENPPPLGVGSVKESARS